MRNKNKMKYVLSVLWKYFMLMFACLRREDLYQALKKKRTQEKLKRRLDIVEEEKNDPEKRKVSNYSPLLNEYSHCSF